MTVGRPLAIEIPPRAVAALHEEQRQRDAARAVDQVVRADTDLVRLHQQEIDALYAAVRRRQNTVLARILLRSR